MTTFASCLRLCGLSQQQAADFFDVRLDTVKSWSAGRNPAPPGVWQMLADLWRRIEDAANAAESLVNLDDRRVWANLSADDADGLPGGACEAVGAMALLYALGDD